MSGEKEYVFSVRVRALDEAQLCPSIMQGKIADLLTGDCCESQGLLITEAKIELVYVKPVDPKDEG